MTVGIGTRGHDRHAYEYHGRTHTAFTCIDWLLAGHAYALRMAPVPAQSSGSALACEADPVALLPESWWPMSTTSAPRR